MNHTAYIEIMHCALSNTKPSSEICSRISLFELYDFASLNKLLPMFAKLLQYWPISSKEEQNLVDWWKNETTRLVFLEYNKQTLIKQLLAKANAKELCMVFFKGYILADLYPEFAMRNSSDTDIYVFPSDKASAFSLLKNMHYTHIEELEEDDVSTFLLTKDEIPLHKIELHTSLYEDLTQKQIDVLENIPLLSKDNIISLNCCHLALNTLNHENHFIYQLLHMAKHLCSHGLPARYLTDLSLFIQKYQNDINWLNVQNIVNKLGYLTFYQQLLSLLIHYFNAPDAIRLQLKLESKEDVSSLLADILSFGMRSQPQDISHYFYCFEKYLEQNTERTNGSQEKITFDGTTVPYNIVPKKYQENEVIQKRILFLLNIKLL